MAGSSRGGGGREFRVIGDSYLPVSQVTLAHYFVTGPFTRTGQWASRQYIRQAHAKEVGQVVTLCGLATSSWTTLWEVPFDAETLHGACPVCRMLAG